jgi:phosphoribosylformylglycinamidine cyclo-ligase
MAQGLTYSDAGVDYDPLDAFKRACQAAAATTRGALAGHGLSEPEHTRGESAYLLEGDGEFLAHVEEGLGTKNLVADAMLEQTGQSFYRNVGIDTVATIVNDLITCGALPISVAMHAAVGDAGWFRRPGRADELAAGVAEGCRQSGAVWGGGETPALRGIVNPDTIVLAGSALGRIRPAELRVRGELADGDQIVLLASSGVQTNGLTLCRALSDRLPRGYLTPLSDGRTYGASLLDPSVIYVRFVAAMQQAGLRPHYLAHMTGHGWRKLMRHPEPLVYRMTRLAPPLPIFDFLLANGIATREAYATFNMGAGFAAFLPPDQAARAVTLAGDLGYTAWIGGHVARDGGRKAVEILPLSITFDAETLQLR